MIHTFNTWFATGLLAGNSAAVAGGIVTLAVLVLLLSCLAVNLLKYRKAPEADFSPENFSLDRYQPMARLLSGDDLAFLAAQPGCRPGILNQFKRDRRRIFRMYLRELAGDFRVLHAAARKLAAVSPEKHSDVVASLLRQQIGFWWALVAIEGRLLLPNLGSLDVRDLLGSVEAVRMDLARMAA